MTPTLVPSEVGTLGAEALRDLVGRAVGGTGIADHVEGDPMDWSVIAEGGWDLLGASEAEGGGGTTTVDLVVLARAWGRSCLPLPYLSTLLAKRWSAAARDHDGPVGLAVGPVDAGRVCFGALESLRLLRTTDPDADDVLVDGPGGDPDPWVPSLRPIDVPWVTGLDAEQRAELVTVLAAESTGVAERVLELSVAFARDREQFGSPIGRFQAVKHRLSTMAVLAESAETAALWAATEPEHVGAAAAHAVETSQTVVEHAIQVHGGMGFTWEVGLHYYLRHVVTLGELVRALAAGTR